MGGTQSKKKILHERLNLRYERVNIDTIDEVKFLLTRFFPKLLDWLKK
jgi:hypothetical protein